MTIPPDQLKAFQEDRPGCVIGRKLAEDREPQGRRPVPLKGDIYPFDLNLTVRGIYDGPANRDRRMCLFHWDYLDEGLKQSTQASGRATPASIFIKCKNADGDGPPLQEDRRRSTRNSDTPTLTQTEEAFGKMFGEMIGDCSG